MGTGSFAVHHLLQGKPLLQCKPCVAWAFMNRLLTFEQIDEIMDRELRIPFVMSEVSLDLIKMMLDRDVERRPTIEQVVAHPWFEDLPTPEEALQAESPIRASTRDSRKAMFPDL